MNRLPVSVIIPTYNRAGLILQSLNSVLAAIEPGDEVIVVDDGSMDNTRETLEPYLDRIRYVAGPHHGVGAARNCGIAETRNPLLAFNDSDDEWFAAGYRKLILYIPPNREELAHINAVLIRATKET